MNPSRTKKRTLLEMNVGYLCDTCPYFSKNHFTATDLPFFVYISKPLGPLCSRYGINDRKLQSQCRQGLPESQSLTGSLPRLQGLYLFPEEVLYILAYDTQTVSLSVYASLDATVSGESLESSVQSLDYNWITQRYQTFPLRIFQIYHELKRNGYLVFRFPFLLDRYFPSSDQVTSENWTFLKSRILFQIFTGPSNSSSSDKLPFKKSAPGLPFAFIVPIE